MNTEKPRPDKPSLRDWIDQSHGIKKSSPDNPMAKPPQSVPRKFLGYPLHEWIIGLVLASLMLVAVAFVRWGGNAETVEDKRKGFHCLSSWDGSHRLFKKEVKSQMRDPDSFEHISTRVSPISPKGTHIAIMKYRARNGFGGMTSGTAVGGYFNDGCMHWIDSIN